jgi:hypothetical protein
MASLSANATLESFWLDEGQLTYRLDGQHLWQTRGPLLVLNYYDRQHPRAQSVSAPSGDGYAFGTAGTPSLAATGQLSIQRIDSDRWLAVASFHEISIRLTLRLQITDDGFDVHLADDDVVEGRPELYRILGIELLPDFGAAVTGESGYLTLPNWSGCQTFFNKSYPREVRQTIYSSNDQWEHCCNMPVFGITRKQGTCCGLVAQGDFDAQLVSHVHWENEHLNGVHPVLVYRWEQRDALIRGPREVRYRFAGPDDQSGQGYVFCGKVCRAFLRAERGLQTWDEKTRTRPDAVDYAQRFFLKIFMAYKDPQADGKGDYHATCTFDEAQQILQQCLDRGMTKLTAILVGWGIDGHDGMPPTRFPVDERLGGAQAMKRLIAWCKEHDIQLGVHDSYGGAYSCSPEFDTRDLIRHRSGEYWESIIWSGGQCHIICPAVYVEKHVKRDMTAISQLGIHGHHHIDAVGSFMTCFSADHPLPSRSEFIQQVRKMFRFAIQQIGSVSTEMPFGPYFDVVDGFFHSYTRPSPWHRASPIGRYFLDRTVPLLSVVLHGSVNCGEAFSKSDNPALDYYDLGLTPQAEVCARASKSFGIQTYHDLAEGIAKVYHQTHGDQGSLAQLLRQTIEARHELAPGVTQTCYSDGAIVIVNRSSEPFDGVAPDSHQVRQSLALHGCQQNNHGSS